MEHLVSKKIFCIGFHKTGTTSLGRALEVLGYRVKGPFGINDPDLTHTALDTACKLIPQYDAFQDNPWPILYKELDQLFPNSKFILTERAPDAWITSQVKHFGPRSTKMRMWIYGAGAPKDNEDIYKARFMAHYQEVKDYFVGREKDLLILNFSKGDGWEKLCKFLNKQIPSEHFPHENKAEDRIIDKVPKKNKPQKTIFGRVKNILTCSKRCK